jgi:dTDP-4-dehydrorhamnose reductase
VGANPWGTPTSAEDAAAAMKDVIAKALGLTLLVVGGKGLLCIEECIDC